MLSLAMFSSLFGVVFFTYRSERLQWLSRQKVDAYDGALHLQTFLQQTAVTLDQMSLYGLDELKENQDISRAFLQLNPALLEVVFLDERGQLQLVISRDVPILTSFVTLSQSSWYKAASQGQMYLGNLNLSADDRPYVTLALPRLLGGVNAALVDMRVLWEVTGRYRVGRSGQIMVVNRNGQVVAHSDPQVQLSRAHVLTNPQYSALLSAAQVDWSGESHDLAGRAVLSAVAPVGDTGWLVIAEVPLEVAFANTRSAAITVTLLMVLTGLFGFYLMLYSMQTLVLKPISRLQRGAELVGHGQLALRLQPDRLDELGQVMLAFNEMTASLQAQRQELNQRARNMEALYQIGLSLISQRGLKAVLDTVINAVFQQFPFTWDVHIFSYENQTLSFRASRYADGRLDVLAQNPSPDGATYTAARQGRIVEVPQRSLMDAQGSDSLIGSMTCLPLKIGLQVVGVLNLAVSPPRRLENDELRGLQLLCDQAAIAIHNARLDEIARHELLERRSAEEELRDLNAHLEQRIAQRTQELWFANEELRREADERQAAMQRLSASLAEKEVLLREIHHRVKNNLQVISSMFNLQAGRIKDPQVIEVLRESQNRLRSMGLIHERLYRSEDLSQVDFSGYIESLAAFLFQAYRFDARQVNLNLDVEPIDLPIDTAVPCGLLLNELIANALKHAFPAGRRGSLWVELKRLPDKNILLRVADDGIGMPMTADLSAGPSMGMTLVRALADQLDGELEIRRENGTEFLLRFPETVVAADR